jgi:hypothetical protein
MCVLQNLGPKEAVEPVVDRAAANLERLLADGTFEAFFVNFVWELF